MMTIDVQIKNLTWNKSTKVFASEASTLGFPVGKWPDEICIVGQTIEVVYFFSRIDHKSNSWVYRPHEFSERKVPGCAGSSLVIFNT